MKFIKNLRVGAKLALGFGVSIAFLIAVVATGSRGTASMHATAQAVVSDSVNGIKDVDALNVAVLRMRLWQFRYFSDQPSSFGDIDTQVGGWIDKAQKALDSYEKTTTVDADRKNVDKYKSDFATYKETSTKFAALMRKGDTAAAATLFKGDMYKGFYALVDQGNVILDYNAKEADTYMKQMNASYSSSMMLLLTLSAIALIGTIFFAIAITKQITKPISQLSERMQRMGEVCVTDLEKGISAFAQGDLTVAVHATTTPLEVDSKDELGKLMETFNFLLGKTQASIEGYAQCRGNLTQLIRQLKDASSQVSSASGILTGTAQQVESAAQEVGASMQEIASASNQAARGASEVATGSTAQAQALSQSSMNIQKLVEAVQSVAKDAESAAEAAETAGGAASDGTSVVGESMKGMTAIRDTVSQSASVIHTLGESSHKIGTIVQTINEIAEQTNLLALNAAIEAARAGEAGRGFAVVADEVRKLAERSGSATREIGALISEIQNHTSRAVAAMENGTKEVESQTVIAESTQAAFQKIQEVFKAVSNRVEDIRSATQGMADASQEVARSITEVAAVVEESSAAAEELSASAEEVSASVDTVAGAAQQQSAAVSELVSASDQLQGLAQTLSETVSSFKIDSTDKSQAPHLRLSKAA